MAAIKGKTNSGLVKYALAQLGLPYWYGTFGQTATESLFKSKSKQYASTGYYTKWKDYPTQYGKRVHDCVGLIKGYMWSDSPTAKPKYAASQDKSACGMYTASTKKGAISGFPGRPGQLVYKSSKKDDPKKIHHVGVYVGSGYVVEAMGHEEGVVKTKFENAGWTHWSQCPYIADDGETGGTSYSEAREGSYEITGKSVYIRETAGAAKTVLGVPVYGKAIGVLYKGQRVTCAGYFAKVDGTEWLKVSATSGGKKLSGWVSGKYLRKVQPKTAGGS